MRLAGDFNERTVTILKEAEKRLAGGSSSPAKFPPKRKRQPSKSEAFTRYLLK